MEGNLGGRVFQGSAVLGGSARLLRSLQGRIAHQRSRVSRKEEPALVSCQVQSSAWSHVSAGSKNPTAWVRSIMFFDIKDLNGHFMGATELKLKTLKKKIEFIHKLALK